MRRRKRVQMLREEYAYIIAILIILFLLIYSWYDREFFYVMTQFLVVITVPASSYGKLLAFFGIAIIVFALLLAVSRLHIKLGHSFRKYAIALSVVAIIVVAMNLLNTMLFVKYADMLHEDYFNRFYARGDFLKKVQIQWTSFEGESTHYYTIDVAAHSHQTKSAIFAAMKALGLNKAIAADIGEGPHAFQTSDEIALIFILSVAAIISLLYLTKNYIGLLLSKKGNAVHKIILVFAYIIVMFQSIHSLYDGGIFANFWVDSLIGLALITLLLKHYVSGDNKWLYLFLIMLLVSPNIYSSLRGFGAGLGINAFNVSLSVNMLGKLYSLLALAYILVSAVGYRKKRAWLKTYSAFIIIAAFIFLSTPNPYFKNWSIYDSILESQGNQTFAAGKLIEVTTFAGLKVPEEVSYEKFTVGDLNIYYLSPNRSIDKAQLKSIIGSADAAVRPLNFTFGGYSYTFYALFDRPVNRSYAQWQQPVDSMRLVYINATLRAYSQAHAAYIAKLDNRRAAIIFVQQMRR